ISRWPSENMHTRAARTTSGLPRMNDSTLRASASYRPANHSTRVATPLPDGSIASSPGCRAAARWGSGTPTMRRSGGPRPPANSRFGTGRSPGFGAGGGGQPEGGMRDPCCDDMNPHLEVGDVPAAAAAPGRHVVYDAVFDEYSLVRE